MVPAAKGALDRVEWALVAHVAIVIAAVALDCGTMSLVVPLLVTMIANQLRALCVPLRRSDTRVTVAISARPVGGSGTGAGGAKGRTKSSCLVYVGAAAAAASAAFQLFQKHLDVVVGTAKGTFSFEKLSLTIE